MPLPPSRLFSAAEGEQPMVFFHDGSNKGTAEALVLCWPAMPMRDQHSGLMLHSAVSFSVQLLIPLFAWL